MQDCIRVSSIESILQYCFRLNYVTNLLHDIHKMKVQNAEFNDTVFKGLSTLTGLAGFNSFY